MKLDIKKLEVFRELYMENARDFAQRIGVSHAWYYHLIQKNNKANPSLDTIGKIGKALGIDPKKLIE